MYGAFALPQNAALTSKNRGSPNEPGSLVRSNTAILLTVAGNTFVKYSGANGRYK